MRTALVILGCAIGCAIASVLGGALLDPQGGLDEAWRVMAIASVVGALAGALWRSAHRPRTHGKRQG